MTSKSLLSLASTDRRVWLLLALSGMAALLALSLALILLSHFLPLVDRQYVFIVRNLIYTAFVGHSHYLAK